MEPNEKHIPSETWDCSFCGATWWIKPGNPVPACGCGFALVKRKPGEAPEDFVLFLQLRRRDADGEVVTIDELLNHTCED
jgi:hypothetical protein